MPSIVKTLRVAADPNRLRILLLLKGEELSVAELQEILAMGQSTISTHLSQLKQAGLVEDRRTGKNNLYRLGPTPAGGSPLDQILDRAKNEIAEAAGDQSARSRVLRKRQDKTRAFFDSVAGRLSRDYVPGKSWKSLAEALLRLLPPVTIADLGAGEGGFALLLARTARRVIAVDSSARMIDVGRAEALRAGVSNVEFRLGDMEELPLGAGEVDLVWIWPGTALKRRASSTPTSGSASRNPTSNPCSPTPASPRSRPPWSTKKPSLRTFRRCWRRPRKQGLGTGDWGLGTRD
jgi:ArsR family transcriptional regulator